MFIGTFGAFFSFPPTQPQQSPQNNLPEPLPGPSRGPARRVKSVYCSLLVRSKAAKVSFGDAPGLREAGERPKGGPRRGPRSPRATHRPPRAILERFWTRRGAFWTQFRPMSAASSRQSSSPSSRGLGRATQDGPTEVQKKLSKKAFQKVFQAICRPDVQSTCPTSCSSRPATVERLIIIKKIKLISSDVLYSSENYRNSRSCEPEATVIEIELEIKRYRDKEI